MKRSSFAVLLALGTACTAGSEHVSLTGQTQPLRALAVEIGEDVPGPRNVSLSSAVSTPTGIVALVSSGSDAYLEHFHFEEGRLVGSPSWPLQDPLNHTVAGGRLYFDGTDLLVAYGGGGSHHYARQGADAQLEVLGGHDYPTYLDTEACASRGHCLAAMITENGLETHDMFLDTAIVYDVGDVTLGDYPVIVGVPNTGFVVLVPVRRQVADVTSFELQALRLDLTGQLVSGPTLVTDSPERIVDVVAAAGTDELVAVFSTASAVHSVPMRHDGTPLLERRQLLAAGLPERPSFASDGDGYLLVYQKDGQSYAKELDANGAPPHEWVAQLAAQDRAYPRVELVFSGSRYVMVGEMDAPTRWGWSRQASSVYAAELLEDGSLLPDPELISTDHAEQRAPWVTFDGRDFVASWIDNREGWDKLAYRRANITPEGENTDQEAVFPLSYAPDLEHVAMATLGTYTLTVSNESNIRGQSLALERFDGTTESASVDDQPRATSVTASETKFLVAWGNSDAIRMVLVDPEAGFEEKIMPIDVTTDSVAALVDLHAVWTGTTFLVTWTDTETHAVSLSEAGAVTDLIELDTSTHDTVDVDCSPVRCVYLVGDEVVAAGLDGIPAEDAHAVPLDVGAGYRGFGGRLSWNGYSFVAVAQPVGDSNSSNPVVVELDETGQQLGGFDQRPVSAFAVDWTLASDEEGHTLIAYHDTYTRGLRGQLINVLDVPGGEPVDAGTLEDAGDGEHADAGLGDAGTLDTSHDDTTGPSGCSCRVASTAPRSHGAWGLLFALGAALRVWRRRPR
jgi:MYXO-CTERM domain-containing protein